MKYIIGIDQSTQGTKAILVDEQGTLLGRTDKQHRQIINEQGWVSHALEEIYANTIEVVKELVEQQDISPEEIAAIGISNQRETTAAWKKDGTPLAHAIVWQCARAKEIVEEMAEKPFLIEKTTEDASVQNKNIVQGKTIAREIEERPGLPLSPYFPAAKMAWLIRNEIIKEMPEQVEEATSKETGDYYLGTMDAYLLYRLTEGKSFCTDMSNASRTQLFNLHALQWDKEICELFGIPIKVLPKVCDSDSDFGTTTLGGYFNQPIPIYCMMGDSHAALFAQGCHEKGMVKTTYGTGSSIMMNIGSQFMKSNHGLATSLAWGIDGMVDYVLEGNINYTGAVITWLKDEMKLIQSTSEVEEAVAEANPEDTTVLVPAFSGLSAPHWDNDAKALIYGMSRTTGRAEVIKAAVESIAFQITDVLKAMEEDSQISIHELRVDGGPTRNKYLMQFQSDMAGVCVQVPQVEEFSALGVAYLAGIRAGVCKKEQLFAKREVTIYKEAMSKEEQQNKYQMWKEALGYSRSV